MNQEELQKEYDKYKDQFDNLKKSIEIETIKVENYNGPFYEVLPFSYQRGGFKQGKLVGNINRIKNFNGIYTYSFNSDGRIIEVREGISIPNNYYYQFLFYENVYIKSFNFDNAKALQNVSFYLIDDTTKKIKKTFLKGKRGGREENYEYGKNGFLKEILIRQFDKKCNEVNSLRHSFEYDENGSLKSIVKSSIDNNYSEIIW